MTEFKDYKYQGDPAVLFEAVDGDENPKTFEYLWKHGTDARIPVYDVMIPEGVTVEDVYEYCLENDCVWQDVLEMMPDDVLT